MSYVDNENSSLWLQDYCIIFVDPYHQAYDCKGILKYCNIFKLAWTRKQGNLYLLQCFIGGKQAPCLWVWYKEL